MPDTIRLGAGRYETLTNGRNQVSAELLILVREVPDSLQYRAAFRFGLVRLLTRSRSCTIVFG
jgi:hypothetical protein